MLSFENEDSIKMSIMFELGYPFLRVELTDEVLTYILNKSISVYTINVPFTKSTTLKVPYNTSEIDLVDDEQRNILGIGMVITESMGSVSSRFFMYPMKSVIDIRTIQDEMKLRILKWQFTEIVIKDVLGVIYTFTYNPNTKKLKMTPSIGGNIYIQYYTEYKNFNEIRPSGKKWIFRYQLQLQKNYLGRIRSKYSGVNTLIGPINTDGEALINESKEELQLLEDELKNNKFTYYRNLSFIG